MIIGGYTNYLESEYVFNFCGHFLTNLSVVETEVWNLISGRHRNISPTLENSYLIHGIGLYVVNFEFCTPQK